MGYAKSDLLFFKKSKICKIGNVITGHCTQPSLCIAEGLISNVSTKCSQLREGAQELHYPFDHFRLGTLNVTYEQAED